MTQNIIETELQKFDVTIEALQEIVAPVRDLKINGASDKQGYNKVREARLMLKNKRVEIEKNGKALREFSVRFQKAVIARENELTSVIEPEELRLRDEETRYEQELERIKEEEQRKEAQRVQLRIDALAKFDYAIDFFDAKTMSDAAFQSLCVQAEFEYKKEQERIVAQKVEEERLKAEEIERLRLEREELDRQKAEQQKREAELEAQRKELQRLQLEKEAAIRSEQERQRKEQEQREAEHRAEMKRQQDILDAERRKVEEERRKLEILERERQAAERARLEEIERAKREEEKRVERERQVKIEAERQEALKPFKTKMLDFADRVMNMCLEVPTSSKEEGAKLHLEVTDFLDKLSNHIKSRVKSL